jgi:hypothetical protein
MLCRLITSFDKTLNINWKITEAVRIQVFRDVTLCRWVISEVSKERNAFIFKFHPEYEAVRSVGDPSPNDTASHPSNTTGITSKPRRRSLHVMLTNAANRIIRLSAVLLSAQTHSFVS